MTKGSGVFKCEQLNDNYMNEEEVNVNSNEANINSEMTSLEVVVKGIKYDFVRDCLLKPLEDTLVSKEITSRVEKVDEDGNVITDEEGSILYDVQTEVKEIPSYFKKGIVLKLPIGMDESQSAFKVGDTVLYMGNTTKDFDLFKDTVLIQPFNIIGVVNE